VCVNVIVFQQISLPAASAIMERLIVALADRSRAKGRLADLLAKIPVQVIVNPNVGLLGAAAVAARF
jgi:glucokinase